MTRAEILQSKGLQSPDNIFKHINTIKTYLFKK
jgi:hypothetical protein